MKNLGVIPARWGSTRFEGKVLAKIAGRPMIQHVWENARKCRTLDRVVIACDSEKILQAAQGFGAEAFLTSAAHASGTDRIAEVVEKHGQDVAIVVNIQGDEPLLEASVIVALVRALAEDASVSMATTTKRITKPEDLANPNVVKVVVDHNHNALYFSRSPVPYDRGGAGSEKKYYKHLGLYAYRREFLLQFKNLPDSNLEKMEQLEQLRALEAGYKIKTIETSMETIGVDTPEDLEKVEGQIKKSASIKR